MLISALLRAKLTRLCVTLPMVAVAAGIAIGPAGLGVVRPDAWQVDPMRLLEEAARLVVALSLMHIAIHLPAGYPKRGWRGTSILLFAGMPLMWALAALAGWLTLGDVGLLVVVLVTACCTPTDPVLSATIVTGKLARRHLPTRVRHLVYAESAANDGLAYPFVFLPLLALLNEPADAWGHWLTITLPWQVVGATAIGLGLGLAAGYLQRVAGRRGWTESDDLTVMTLALTLTVVAAMELVETDSVLAVFAAGLGFRHLVSGQLEGQEETIQRVVLDLVQLPTFVLLGAMLPWGLWYQWGWRGVAFGVLLLLVRRPPSVALLLPWLRLTGQLRTWREAAFVGWFGPVGIAAIYYATLCRRALGEGGEAVWALVSLAVLASVVLHGVTSYPLTRAFHGKR